MSAVDVELRESAASAKRVELIHHFITRLFVLVARPREYGTKPLRVRQLSPKLSRPPALEWPQHNFICFCALFTRPIFVAARVIQSGN